MERGARPLPRAMHLATAPGSPWSQPSAVRQLWEQCRHGTATVMWSKTSVDPCEDEHCWSSLTHQPTTECCRSCCDCCCCWSWRCRCGWESSRVHQERAAPRAAAEPSTTNCIGANDAGDSVRLGRVVDWRETRGERWWVAVVMLTGDSWRTMMGGCGDAGGRESVVVVMVVRRTAAGRRGAVSPSVGCGCCCCGCCGCCSWWWLSSLSSRYRSTTPQKQLRYITLRIIHSGLICRTTNLPNYYIRCTELVKLK